MVKGCWLGTWIKVNITSVTKGLCSRVLIRVFSKVIGSNYKPFISMTYLALREGMENRLKFIF